MKKIKFQYKSILLYLFAGFLVLQGVSCKKYLQVQPRDFMFEDEAFATPKGVESVLNGIYQSLADSLLYGNALTMNITENMAQYYSGIGDAHGNLYVQFIYTEKSIAMFDNIWKTGYRAILGVNNFCDKLEDPNYKVIEPEMRNVLLGEAYALRAFFHFDQLRYFGPVYAKNPNAMAIPYSRKASISIQPLMQANNVMDQILKDLDSALVLLEKDPVRTKGVSKATSTQLGKAIDYMSNRHYRMNYYAVKALTARVLLYAGKKAEAWAMTSAVMLEQEAFFPWLTDQEMAKDPQLSKETFFGIDNRRMYDHNKQLFSALLKDSEIYTPKPARLESIYNISSSDLRLKHWFKTGTEGEKQYKVFIKYSNATITDASLRYYQPLIRKSELYLIAAETAPDLERGYYYLNSLRVNKGLAPVNYNAGSSAAELITAIRAEYQREFIGEGQTFFMFKRLNLAEIPHFSGAGVVYMTDEKYTWPFPANETYYR